MTDARAPIRALVVGGGPLHSPGGVEAVCRAWIDSLARAGFDVRYISSSDTLARSAMKDVPFDRYWRSAAEVALTRLAARHYAADVVVTNGPIGWGVSGSKASLHMYHGTYRGQAARVSDAMSRRGRMKLSHFDGGVLERAAGRSKRCLANSAITASEVERWYGHACDVVPPPINVDVFTPGRQNAKFKNLFDSGLDRPRGLFIGSGRPTKGEHIAFDVMRRTPDVAWLLLGGPPLESPPPRVRYLDAVDPTAMPELLRATDLLLVTSAYESFGIVIAEALACGTPVVSGPSGASDMLMRGRELSAWRLASPHNPDAFAAVVDGIAHDVNNARNCAVEHGRPLVVEQLSVPAWRARIDAILHDALETV